MQAKGLPYFLNIMHPEIPVRGAGVCDWVRLGVRFRRALHGTPTLGAAGDDIRRKAGAFLHVGGRAAKKISVGARSNAAPVALVAWSVVVSLGRATHAPHGVGHPGYAHGKCGTSWTPCAHCIGDHAKAFARIQMTPSGFAHLLYK